MLPSIIYCEVIHILNEEPSTKTGLSAIAESDGGSTTNFSIFHPHLVAYIPRQYDGFQ